MDGTGDPGTRDSEDGRKRAILIAVGVVAGIALISFAVWALFWRGSADEEKSSGQSEIEHAQPTSPDRGSSDSTSASEATATPDTGVAGAGSGPADGQPVSTAFHRNPVVAYRLNGALYVSGEDGTGAVQVAPSASGVFSLSPDGRSLAYVDQGTRELLIADVASGARSSFGAAEQVTPVWAPSSEWVLFTRSSGTAAASSVYRTDVLRAQRAGGVPAVLASGLLAAAAPDARNAVLVDVDGGQTTGYSLKVLRDDNGLTSLPVQGPVTGLATDGASAYVAVSHMGEAAQAQDGIWRVPLDGSPPTRLVTAAPAARPVETRSLMLSPDGARLAYATTGDDGYSRVSVVSTTGGTPLELVRRRDTYLIGWSADGSAVFFVEGNAWQGEPTELVRARPDGSGHTVVVQGAGL